MSFVHLHVHSDGSVFDGACKPSRLVKRAVELGMTAIGITDHGNMIKTYEFQEECIKNGIKPIIGCEFYVGLPEIEGTYHLLCIAKNNEGLKNLYQLNAYAYSKNFYYKPRITYEQLQQHKNGLIVTTACIGSEVGDLYLKGDKSASMTLIERLKGIVDELYLEIQPNSIPAQAGYNKFIVEASRQLNIPLVATCDTHYVYKEDYTAHDVMLAMQVKKKVDDPDRFKFSGNDYYLKSEDEIIDGLAIQGIGANTIADALYTTQYIADSCTAKIEPANYMPHLDCDEDKVLAEHCAEGWKWRYDRSDIQGTQEEYDRVQYELQIIKEKGYSGYYLIVEDFVQWAKSKGILVGAGRGSGAGSMIAYLLNITNVHPIKYGLLFERFLNPTRNSPPDFDIDFDYERRSEVVEYVKQTYGADRVAHIIAEGTMACNAVCRRVLSTYGFEQHYINKICNSIPDVLGITLEKAYNASPEFKNYMDKHKIQYEVMKTLEGLMSHVSQHAAGIVICNQPITDVVPCMTVSDDRSMLVTQWHKKILEKLGFFKFDFLALKTLTLIDNTIKRIKENYGIDIDLEKIDLEDKTIYRVLNSGDLSGVFQMSEPAGQQIIEKIKPNFFNDVVAANALMRPGVKEKDIYINNKSSGRMKIDANCINEVLKETCGAIVYQEQTMLLMNRLTNGKWSLGKADSMRKVKDLEEYREDFVNCCKDNGVSDSIANSVFDRFDLGYSFNKSHAVCYSVTTNQTAWLKGHYRKEFMAELMTIDIANTDITPSYIKECKRYGINVLIPEINSSLEWFVTTGNDILMPLNAIKGVGDAAASVILKERENGSFDSLQNFLERTKNRAVNKKVVLSLIKAGCFDKLNPNRSILIAQYLASRNESANVMTWCDEICIHYELETLGIALTKHPLDGMNIPQFSNQPDGVCVTGGIVSKVTKITDKNSKDMAFVTIENKTDVIEVICFAYVYNKFKSVIQESNIIRVSGRKEGQKIIADMLEVL